MMLRMRHKDKHGGEDGKHIGLYETHQRVEQEHKQGESEGEHRCGGTHSHSKQAAENEYQRHKHNHHHVAAHHIGKQTNHQRDGLGEDAENFNHRHQRQFQSHGHVGPENFQYSLLPVRLVTRNVATASTMVTAKLPVRLAPPGNITIKPSKFIVRMKKKQVSK